MFLDSFFHVLFRMLPYQPEWEPLSFSLSLPFSFHSFFSSFHSFMTVLFKPQGLTKFETYWLFHVWRGDDLREADSNFTIMRWIKTFYKLIQKLQFNNIKLHRSLTGFSLSLVLLSLDQWFSASSESLSTCHSKYFVMFSLPSPETKFTCMCVYLYLHIYIMYIYTFTSHT